MSSTAARQMMPPLADTIAAGVIQAERIQLHLSVGEAHFTRDG